MIEYAVSNDRVVISFNPTENTCTVFAKNGFTAAVIGGSTKKIEEDFWDLFENFNEALDFKSVVEFFKTKIKV